MTSERVKLRQSFCGELEGSRIVNLDNLQEFIDQLMTHASQCSIQIILSGEKKAGLASIISSRCQLSYSFDNIKESSWSQWQITVGGNLAAVWGQMSTGGGYSKLHETMTTLGIPVMSSKNFVDTERSIGRWWEQQLVEVMAEAGRVGKKACRGTR